MQIKGKTFFITGGSSGLGVATATEIMNRGGNVVIIDIKPPPAEFLKDGKIVFVKADVTSSKEIAAAISYATAKFKDFGGVVNCSGVSSLTMTIQRDGSPLDLNLFKSVIDVNLIGTANVSSQVASLLSKQQPDEQGERGVIINVSSIAHLHGQKGQLAYAASKGGVASMTLPMARDLSRYGIRVCAIAPGPFETPMASFMKPKLRDALITRVEYPKRFGRPDEFARLAVHLIENTYMNGGIFNIDAAARF